jgi:uncharacterized repeat protein (TIGR01451 family)
LLSGGSDTIVLNVRVPAGLAAGNYDNTATVTWDSGSDSDTEGYTVQVEADLRAEKQALTTEVAPGGTALFKVSLFNNGPSDAVGVIISDTLPAGFVPGSQVIAPAEAGTTGITIPAGGHAEVFVSMVVDDGQAVGTVLTNVAEVVFADDPNGANNSSSDTVTVIDALPDADVEVVDVRLMGGGPIVPGNPAPYRFEIDVRNNGPADALGAVVTTVLLDAEYIIDDMGLVGNWSPADGIWTHDGPWAPGALQTLWVDVLIPADAHQTALDAMGPFYAWIAVANPQGIDAGQDWDSVSFDTQAQATLTLDKTLLNDGVAPGGTALYEIVVCNSGPSDIDGVAVTDTLGMNLAAGTLVLSPDAGSLYIPADQCVDVLATAQVVDTAAPGDPFTNTASVDTSGVVQGAGATLPPVVNAPSDTAGGTVGEHLPAADVEVVDVRLVGGGPIVPGGTATLEIDVRNNGPADALGVVVTTEFLDVAYIYDNSAVPDGWSFSGTGGTFVHYDPWAPGGVETIELFVIIPADAHYVALDPLGAFYAYIAAANPQGADAGQNWDTVTFNTQPQATLTLDKTLLNDGVAPGGTALYEIVVCNNGPSDIDGVAVTDTLGLNLAAGTLVLSPDAGSLYIPAGQCVDVLATAQIADTAASGDPFTNTASVDTSGVVQGTGATLPPVVNAPSDTAVGTVGEYLPDADVELVSKTFVNPPAVPGGGDLIFEIVVRNNGPAEAEGVVLVDTFYDVDYLVNDHAFSTPPGVWRCSSGLTCARQDPMPVGATEAITLYLRIPADAYTTLPDPANNRASVVANNPDPNIGNSSLIIGVPIAPEADLGIAKSVIKDEICLGAYGFYEIVVTNDGPSDAENVVVTDTLPAGLVYGGGSPECGLVGGDVVCTIGTLGAGQSYDLLIGFNIDPSVISGAVIANTADVGSTTPDPGPLPNTSNVASFTAVQCFLPEADMTIVKTMAPDPVVAGTPIRVTLDITNQGPHYAENVVVHDLFKYAERVEYATLPYPWAIEGGVTLRRLGEPMPPNTTETIEFDLYVAPDRLPGIYDNVAFVGADNPDPWVWDNADVYNYEVTAEADLGIAKSVIKDEICLGAYGIYEIVVTNNGPSDAQNVQVTDALPDDLVYGGGSPECTHDGSATGGNVVCDLGTLGAGQSYDLMIGFNIWQGVISGTLITNTADVLSTTPDPGPSPDTSNPAIFTTVQCFLPDADMDIAKAMAPDPVNAGETVRITLTVSNNGPHAAEGVVVQDRIGFGEQVDNFAFSNGADWSCDRGVTCVRQTPMVSGAVEWIAFDLHVAADRPAGSYDNHAYVVADNPDPDPADNEAGASYEVTTLASLSIFKADLWDPVIVGGLGSDTAVYVLTVQNTGPSYATNVVVTDTLPAGMIFGEPWIVNASYAGAPSSCAGSPCNLGTLPAGETVEIYVTVHVTDPALCDTTVDNTAGVSWDDSVGTHTDTVIEDSELVCQGDLDLKKTGPYTTTILDTFTYYITVTNTGPSPIPAGELTLEDEIPAGLTFVGLNNLVGPCGFAGGPPVWTSTGDLPAGGVCVVGIDVTVDEGVCPAGVIFNEAQVHDEDNNIDQAGWVTLVDCSTTLSVDKEILAGAPVAGTVVNYIIAVTNTGNVTAYDVELTDNIYVPFPTGAQIVDFIIVANSFGYAPDGGECTSGGYCNLPDLPVGGWIWVIASVQIDPDYDTDLTGMPLYQTACAEADNAGLACDATLDPITSAVNLGIQKDALAGMALVGGDPIQYVITVWNTGPSDAFNVVVTDTAQTYFSLVGGLVPGNQPMDCSAGDSCTIPVLRAGESVEIYASLEVSSDAPAGLLLANNACITQVDPAIEGVIPALPICDAESTEVVVEADVSLAKTATPTALAGGTIDYDLFVYNAGPADAHNVALTDTLPISTTFAGWDYSEFEPNDAFTDALNLDLLDWTTAYDPDIGDSLGNTSMAIPHVTLYGTGDQTWDLYAFTVSNVGDRAIFDIDYGWTFGDGSMDAWLNLYDENGVLLASDDDFFGPDDGSSGQGGSVSTLDSLLEYTFAATGTFYIEVGSFFDDPADAGGDYVLQVSLENPVDAAQAFCYWQGWPNVPEGVMICQAGTMAAGTGIGFHMVVTADNNIEPGTSLENWAVVHSSTSDPDGTNNTANADTSIVAEADLELIKTGSATVIAGNPIYYTITVTNTGPSVAQAVDVKDDLPAGVTLDSATVTRSGGGPALCGGTVCQVGDMAVGEVVTINIVGTVDASVASGTVFTNTATVFAVSHDPDPSDDSDVHTTLITAEADLGIEKAVIKDEICLGAYGIYEIVVTNDGPSDAHNVQVTDVLPPELIYGGASPGCTHDGSATGGTVTCDLGTLGAGQSYDLMIGFNIEPNVISGTLITNTADVGSTTPDPNAANDTSPDVVFTAVQCFLPEVDMGIDKTMADPVVAGTSVLVHITVTNNGPHYAENVTVQDLFFFAEQVDNLAFSNFGAWSCDGGVTCVRETPMPPNTTEWIEFDLFISPDRLPGFYNNYVFVVADNPDPGPSPNMAVYTYEVTAEADLSIAKAVIKDEICLGAYGIYEIVVTNDGPSDAQNVVVTDTLPAELIYGGGSPECQLVGGDVICDIGTLGAGQSYDLMIGFNIEPSVISGTLITNTADVGSTTPDPGPLPNTSTATFTATQCFLPEADMSVDKDVVTDPWVAGTENTIRITVTNNGPHYAEGVAVLDPLYEDTLLVGFQQFAADGVTPIFEWGCDAGVSCVRANPMAPGTTEVLELRVELRPDAADLVPGFPNAVNYAFVAADNPDPDLADNYAMDPFVIASSVNLTVVKDDIGADMVAGGDPMLYTIQVYNSGPSNAYGVVVTDTASSPYFSLVGDLEPGDQPMVCGGNICIISVLEAGQSVEIYAMVAAAPDTPPGIQPANTACISAVDPMIGEVNGLPNPNALPICDTEDTNVTVAADMAIDKTGPLTATANDVLTYTIEVYNNGPSDADNVVVTDTLPYGVIFLGDSLGACSEVQPGIVVCDIGTVPAYTTIAFEIYVQAAPDVCYEGKVNNYVEVNSSTPDPDPANNDDDWGTVILNGATLTIDKTTSGPANAGETIDFTLVVENIGPGCATGVVVVDELMNGLLVESYTAAAYSCSAGGVCVRTSPLLASDPADVITLTVRVPADLTPGDYDNTATVTWDSGSAADTEPYTVNGSADLGIAKAVIKDEICLGAYGVYEIVVTNDGPSDAANVVVTDTLPAELIYGGASPECQLVGGDVICDIGTLGVGQSYDLMIGFNIDPSVISGTVVVNTADVGSTTPDPGPLPNTSTATFTAVQCFLPEVDMSVEKDVVTDPWVAGTENLVRITVTNNGLHYAENVAVLDPLYEDTLLVGFQQFAADGVTPIFEWGCDAGVACVRANPMAPGTSEVLELRVELRADAEDLVPGFPNGINYAFVTADNPDPDTGNNVATDRFIIGTSADLGIAKAVIKDEVCLGAYGIYEIVVTNNGPSDAQNVVVTDTLPAELIYGGASPECHLVGGDVICDIGTLGVGQSYDLMIGFNIDPNVISGTLITNTADVGSTTPDPGPLPNTSTATFTAVQCFLPEADMSVVKDVVTDPWVAGTENTIRITVTNNGPHYAENVVVLDPLYEDTLLVGFQQFAADGVTPIFEWGCDAGVACVRANPMAPGTTEVLELRVELRPDAADLLPGFPIATNYAFVSADNPDPNLYPPAPNPNVAWDSFTVETEVTLSIEKNALATEIAAGGAPEIFAISVYNAGPSDAYDVVVQDTVDPGLTLVSLTGDLPAVCVGNACTIPEIPAKGSIELYALVEAPSSTPAGTYSNTVAVTGAANDTFSTPSDVATIEVVVQADLAIDKTGPLTVTADAIFAYTITVYNNGPADALAPIVTDLLPYGVSYLGTYAASAGVICPAAPASDQVICTLPDMAPSDVVTIVLDVRSDPAACYEGKVNNYVEVSSSTPDQDPANNDDDWGTVILNQTVFTIDKVASPDPVLAGDLITFTLTVVNQGPGCATGVVVVDELGYGGNPPGLVIEDYDASNSTQGIGPLDTFWYACSSGGVCQRAEPMPPNTTDIITLFVRVPASTVPGDYTNYADVIWDSGNAQDTEDYEVQAEADLSVAKSDLSDPVGPTEGLIYEIVVANSGPSDAQNVVVTDTLGANLTFATASPGCNETAPGSGVITCTLGTVPAGGSADLLIAVIVGDVASGTVLTNTADVGSDTYDPDLGNNQAVENTLVQQPVGPSADLSITKSASPTTVIAGELVTYTLVITNGGPSTAYNVQVLEMVPDGATIIAAIPENPDFDYEFCTLSGVCYLGTVHPTTTATITTIVRVEPDFAGATLTNLASVSGDQIDYFPANNITSAVVDVTTWANLSLTKVDLPDPVVAGEVLVYQLRVSNSGPSDAQGVFITDTIAISTTFVGGSDGCVASGQDVTCTIGTLPAGEEALTFIEVRTDEGIPDATIITNTACVSATNGSSDCAQATTLVVQSALNPTDLEIGKTAVPATVIAGERLTYTIVVTNNGPAPATSVQVVDYLPTGLDLVSTTPSQGLCQIDLTCDLGDIAIGGNATVTIVVDVHSDQLAPLTNIARVSASNPDTIVGNNEATVITPVDTEAFLVIDKTANPYVVTPGGPLSYEIVVSNNGPSDARNVVVTDTLPAELVGPVFSASQGSCIGNVCSLGTIPAGEDATISIIGSVAAGVTAPFTNTAELSASTTNTNPVTTASVRVVVWAVTDLSLDKDATPTVNAGEPILYTLTVLHQGPSDAQNVVLTDTLPVSVTFVAASPACADLGGGTVVCTQAVLPAGGTSIFTITAVTDDDIEPGTSLENVAVVDSDTVDNNPANNIDTADTSIVGVTDLVLDKTGPDFVIIGGQITYTITVINQGPSEAQDVEIKDTLPAGVTLVGASVVRSGGGPGVCFDAVCQVSNVAVGEVVTMTVVVTVDDTFAGEVITNTATLFTDTPDSDPSNDSDYHVTVVPRIFLPVIYRGTVPPDMPDLVVDMSLTPDQSDFQAGEPVTITVVVTNQGTAAAGAFWVDFFINPNPVPVAANLLWPDTCTLDPCYGIAWHVPAGLGPGESIVLTSSPDSYSPEHTIWVGSFVSGTTDLYVYVDSYDPSVIYGAVEESNETNNRFERHGLSVEGSVGRHPSVPIDMPPRPRPF